MRRDRSEAGGAYLGYELGRDFEDLQFDQSIESEIVEAHLPKLADVFGRDLVYRSRDGWVAQPEYSKDNVVKRAHRDGSLFRNLLKNTYRVLLTRGLRGCYVYFMDAPTRDFVLSRIERSGAQLRRVAEVELPYGGS